MMNWPGSAFFATIGASISYRITVGFSASFFTMRYMDDFSFLFGILRLAALRAGRQGFRILHGQNYIMKVFLRQCKEYAGKLA